MESEHLLISLGLILIIGIFAQYIAWRIKVPSIVLLTLFGFILGPIGGFLDPHHSFGHLLHPFIELAVAIILFEGGLSLRIYELKELSTSLLRLITLGLVFSFIFGTLAAYFIGGFSLDSSLLISGILVVTGPTVIIPILRNSKLDSRIKSFLKWEGIINDPLGVLLVALVYQFVISTQQDINIVTILVAMLKAIAISVVFAVAVGNFFRMMLIKSQIPDYLKIPSILAITIASFLISRHLQDGAGLLTVTFLGIYFGNTGLAIVNDLRRFKESVSIILVSIIFILLSAGIEFKSLALIGFPQIIFIILATFFIRPLSIGLATINSKMSIKERLLLGYFGPKGIVAASVAGIFGLRLEEMGYPNADLILPVVFTIVCSTVFIHSLSLEPLGKFLNLSVVNNKGLIIAGASRWATDLALVLHNLNIPVLISDINWKRLKMARQQGLKIHYGQILVDVEDGNLDLNEYEYLLAATNNDSYNALVCQGLAEDFGNDNVFQLPLHEDDNKPDELPAGLRGRILKNDELIYEELRERYKEGFKFKTTKLTEAFNFEDFSPELHGIVFLIVKNSGDVVFLRQNDNYKPVLGDIMVSFVKLG